MKKTILQEKKLFYQKFNWLPLKYTHLSQSLSRKKGRKFFLTISISRNGSLKLKKTGQEKID